MLAATSLWPLRTLTSFRARVLHQAAALHCLADESDGRFIVVESRRDLDRVLARHAEDPTVIGGLLDIEGAHAPGRPLDAAGARSSERAPVG